MGIYGHCSVLSLQLHDADEYLIDRADYSWDYSGLQYSSTEQPQAGPDYNLYQPAAQYSQHVPSQPLQPNQTAWQWQYSAEQPYQDHRLSTRFSPR